MELDAISKNIGILQPISTRDVAEDHVQVVEESGMEKIVL